MSVDHWNLSDGMFVDANLSGIKISNTQMSSSSFIRCVLDQAVVEECNIYGSTLQYASLFLAEFENVNLEMSDLTYVVAVRAKFKNKCKLNNSNCAEADFSRAEFYHVSLIAARLYNSSFTNSFMKKCCCQYLLADNIQFTFAKCLQCDFSFSSFTNANMTKSTFEFCKFNGAWLNDMNATQTKFFNCDIQGVDFKETRFVNAILCGKSSEEPMIIKKCDFTNCKFERVLFENVKFKGCIFEKTVFIDCQIKHVESLYLNKHNFNKISDSKNWSVKYLCAN